MDRQLPKVGTQFEPDRFEDGLPGKTDPGLQIRLPAGNDGLDPIRSPDDASGYVYQGSVLGPG